MKTFQILILLYVTAGFAGWGLGSVQAPFWTVLPLGVLLVGLAWRWIEISNARSSDREED